VIIEKRELDTFVGKKGKIEFHILRRCRKRQNISLIAKLGLHQTCQHNLEHNKLAKTLSTMPAQSDNFLECYIIKCAMRVPKYRSKEKHSTL